MLSDAATAQSATDATPVELRLSSNRRHLTLAWSNGRSIEVAAAAMRARCRCAQCRRARLDAERAPGTVPAPEVASDIAIDGLEPVGTYAVRVTFSDRHYRGLFPWTFLCELAAIEAASNEIAGPKIPDTAAPLPLSKRDAA